MKKIGPFDSNKIRIAINGVNQERKQTIISKEKITSKTRFKRLLTSLSNGIVRNEIIGI